MQIVKVIYHIFIWLPLVFSFYYITLTIKALINSEYFDTNYILAGGIGLLCNILNIFLVRYALRVADTSATSLLGYFIKSIIAFITLLVIVGTLDGNKSAFKSYLLIFVTLIVLSILAKTLSFG